MEHCLDAIAREHFPHQSAVRHVADHQRDALGQSVAPAGRQIVQHDDHATGVTQGKHHMTADIARAAGYQHGFP